MSDQADDDITVIVGDDELSQDLETNQNPVIMIIIKKQHELREEMLKLQGKMEILNEILLEHFVIDNSDNTSSVYEE